MPLPLDQLPADRLGNAMRMIRTLRRGDKFFAPLGSPESVAVIDLLRANRVELVGENHLDLGIRLRHVPAPRH